MAGYQETVESTIQVAYKPDHQFTSKANINNIDVACENYVQNITNVKKLNTQHEITDDYWRIRKKYEILIIQNVIHKHDKIIENFWVMKSQRDDKAALLLR